MPKRSKCFILPLSELPEYIQKNYLIKFDGYIQVSEHEPRKLKKGFLEDLWRNKKEKGYESNFFTFIEEENYQLERWLIAEGFNFDDIDMILIKG